ncbi:hypothetical protein LY76DRAFT_650486 [Colletotrichum caudatum]|nr:hypothetical protein LY76DRAFT_650486 [Colletotrichum caudatum]
MTDAERLRSKDIGRVDSVMVGVVGKEKSTSWLAKVYCTESRTGWGVEVVFVIIIVIIVVVVIVIIVIN